MRIEEGALVEENKSEEASFGAAEGCLQMIKSIPQTGSRQVMTKIMGNPRRGKAIRIQKKTTRIITNVNNGSLCPCDSTALERAVTRFNLPRTIQHHLESLGTPREKSKELVQYFSKMALEGKIVEVNKQAIGTLATDSLEVGMTFESMGTTRAEAIAHKLDKILWDAFFTHCEGMFPPDVQLRLSRMRAIADLRYPAEWHPKARQMTR